MGVQENVPNHDCFLPLLEFRRVAK